MRKMSFYTDPAVIQLILDTTEDSEKKLDYASRLGFASDIELLDYKLKSLGDLSKGEEDWRHFKEWMHDVVVLVSRLGNRIYKIGRTLVENTTKQYGFMAKMWNDRLQKNLDKIVDERFNSLVVSTVDLDILKRRVEVVGRISQLLEKSESVVNSPIHDVDDPNSYNTPEFVECYKDLKDIGFNMTNKTFVESKSQGYSSKEEKKSMEEHGYSKSSLVKLTELAKTIASTATKKWLETTVAKFQHLNGELEKHEKAIIENRALEESEKQVEIKKVSIRISRLWWLSNFIHLLQKLSEDCMKYMLKVFRAADDSIPQATNKLADEYGGNKYYF